MNPVALTGLTRYPEPIGETDVTVHGREVASLR
jgi:hypothetical protein